MSPAHYLSKPGGGGGGLGGVAYKDRARPPPRAQRRTQRLSYFILGCRRPSLGIQLRRALDTFHTVSLPFFFRTLKFSVPMSKMTGVCKVTMTLYPVAAKGCLASAKREAYIRAHQRHDFWIPLHTKI